MEGGGSHGFKKPRSTDSSKSPKKSGEAGVLGGAGGVQSAGEDECDITVVTVLNRVDSEALKAAPYGAPLDVQIIDENDKPRLVVRNGGNRVGDINDANALKVVGCIRQGRQYVAIIIDRRENYCKVRIQLAK